MKKILFICFVAFTHLACAQNYELKTYRPIVLNQPLGVSSDSIQNGYTIPQEIYTADTINFYMDFLFQKYYVDTCLRYTNGELKIDSLNSTYIEPSNISLILYYDSPKNIIIEKLRIYYEIPGFCYGYFSQVKETASGEITYELYIIKDLMSIARINITTGECVAGNPDVWEEFNLLSGFQEILRTLDCATFD